MSSYLSAAAALFARTNISQHYTILQPGSSAPAPPANSGLPSLPVSPPFKAGLWFVQSAQHKLNGKRVSVWTLEKRGPELERLSAQAREMALEVSKMEASALGRLRHPCVLEMVEPMEETRSEFVFATEPLVSTLQQAIPTSSSSSRNDNSNELDEIEIQKGVLQLSRGLAFLHTSAKLVHTNITPYTILINLSGDWKLGGLGLTIPLTGSDGSPTRWEMPENISSLPGFVQRNFDYMAPEYALDSQITVLSDMYAIGCLLYAVHSKGSPPFRNHGSIGTLRSNVDNGIRLTGMEAWDPDLKSLLSQLITRHPQARPTAETLPSNSFFNSLPISTLNFLERSNFASKSREEKIAFMKGLGGVLPRFSRSLREKKILSALLEEMKDPYLLPSILPNVFLISSSLSPQQFASRVLPSLKPLFAVKDPPQNMITLLDNLGLVQEKCEKAVFREHVLPLVYNALESEHAIVQERALKIVPDLCETIDYAEVQSVLFPRVALVFTKTRILSVKVNTLVCFLSMVKTLDQSSLTQKLVPLLAKIRTKEPAVMLATLNVHEAMGQKVDREAVATLVLPQLWTMSMGPLLNVSQFARFMSVIHTLSERVEKEHSQYLRDSQRNEDRSTVMDPSGNSLPQLGGEVDFQTLVSGNAKGGSGSVLGDVFTSNNTGATKVASWEDDVWGSILDGTESPRASTPVANSRSSLSAPASQVSSPSLTTRHMASPSPLRPPGTTQSISSAPVIPPPPPPRNLSNSSFHRPQSSLSASSTPTISPMTTLTPTLNSLAGNLPNMGFKPAIPPPPNKPNYNIFMSTPTSTTASPPQIPTFPLRSTSSLTAPTSSTPPPPSMSAMSPQSSMAPQPAGGVLPFGGNIMAPSKPAWNVNSNTGGLGGIQPLQPLQPKKIGKDDWGDFDPLA